MQTQPLDPAVLVAPGPVVSLCRPDLESLKTRAGETASHRARICTHQDMDDRLHEMLIVLGRGTYIRPHRHPAKTESFHIVEGEADLVLFDGNGRITNVLHMGEYHTGRVFYYRLCAPYFHTVIVRSDFVVLHETTNGPFQRSDTLFAPWAPEETNLDARTRYMVGLEDSIRRFDFGAEKRLSA